MDGDDDNDDNGKSVIDKLIDVVTNSASEVTKAALPSGQMTNGLLIGDAAIAPEAIPVPTARPARKKRAAAPYRANKRVAPSGRELRRLQQKNCTKESSQEGC